MQFALLYYYDPAVAGPTMEELVEWMAFDAAVRKAGAFVDAARFQSANQARTVRVRNGDLSTQPGSPAGTPVLAGYYVITADSLETATEWARRIPTATYGAVEIRPVIE